MQAGREIKLRGMDIQGNWHFGNLTVLQKAYKGIEAGCYISNDAGAPFAYAVRPETVGQFTGLRDKNGKEIYEGDVGERDGVIYRVTWVERGARYGVKIVKTDHVLTRGLTFPLHQYVTEDSMECKFVVIGNIYENPELVPAA